MLQSPFPNPTNSGAWIPFVLTQDAAVRLAIYNVSGQLVRTLKFGRRAAGHYLTPGQAAYWDATDDNGRPVGSGVYIFRMTAPGLQKTRKMVLLR